MPDISALRRIKVISELSDAHLIALANQLRVIRAHDRELLIQVGSTETCSIYVISGKVSLSAHDGKTKVISADETREIRPLAQLRPSIYDVRAVGTVSYLSIEQHKLVEFSHMSTDEVSNISVHTLLKGNSKEDISIINDLYHNVIDNSIKLPTLPSVADRFQHIYRGKATDTEALSHILISYPDVTRIIKNVARCSRDDNLSEMEKIRFSINRLGIQSVYCLVMTHALGKLVRRLPVNHMQRVKSFWDHSLNVAAVARIIAKWTRSFSPDLAMLAGLAHGIGVLIIDDRLLEHRHLRLDHLEVDHAIQIMRPEISGLLLRKWDFSNDLIQVAEQCGDWSRNENDSPDLCDLVLVANYYAMLHSDENHLLPKAGAIPAIEKFRITPDQAIEAIRKSTDVKRNIKKLFV